MDRNMKIISAFVIAFMFVIPTGATLFSGDAYNPEASVIEPQIDTVVLQPNATVGKDAWIANETYGLENMGADTDIYIGTGGMTPTDNHKGLFYFDMQTGSRKVLSATLSLYSMYIDLAGKINVTVNPLTSSWTEGTGIQASGETGYVNGVNRTNGTAWGTPMGDIDYTRESYLAIDNINLWYSWDVTTMVDAWITGAIPNYGFIVNGTPIDTATNYVGFWSSDYTTDPTLWPKLTLTYAVEITDPVPAQTFNEDDPARTISLAGRANGSVVHTSGASWGASGYPFGTFAQVRYQSVYTPEQVGAEGVIMKISMNRSDLSTSTFNNLHIYLAHTTLDDLNTDFTLNYQGSLIEVFNEPTYFVNSSNGDTWIHFDLNDNFTYDSQYNLLVDLQWVGMSGSGLEIYCSSDFGVKRIANTAGGAIATFTNGNLPAYKFTTDVVNNAVIDVGTGSNQFPFVAVQPQMRMQMLYNHTLLNESGIIDNLRFQASQLGFYSVNMADLSIKLGHSTNDSLDDNNFDQHYTNTLTEVFSQSTYVVSTAGSPEWIDFDIDNTFNYNGIDNLLIDISWSGSSGPDTAVELRVNYSATYVCRMWAFTHDAIVATSSDSGQYNIQAIFAESDNLTWSVTSSNTSLFTAAISGGQNLVITPKADANGAGTARLTLANSEGGSVTQDIPITINAVNDEPTIESISDIICTEDIPFNLDITNGYADIDDDIANLILSTDSAFVDIDGNLLTFLYPEGWTEDIVTITVEDAGGAMSSTTVNVTINPVNDVPMLTNFVDSLECDATVQKSIALHPEDEESTSNNLIIYTDSDYVTVNGMTLAFLYPKGMGTDTVNIYLIDEDMYGSQNNISYMMNITIIDHPEVTTYNPVNTSVPVMADILVTFDMPMDNTKTENAFSLKRGTSEIMGTFTWSADNRSMTFAPTNYLAIGTYDVEIAASAETIDGIRMLSAFQWNFTTLYGDFDNDGMPDQYEIENGLDPEVDDANADLDDDGMPNIYESENDLDPAVDDAALDADGDGMPNIYEYENDLDPGVNDADLDSDGDGVSNFDEFEAGTDPDDADDKPSSIPWLLIIIIIIVIVVVIVVVMLLMKKKGNTPEPAQEFQDQMYQQPPPPEGQEFQAPVSENSPGAYDTPPPPPEYQP